MAKNYSSYIKTYNKYLNQYTKELNEYYKSVNKYNSYVTPTTSSLSYSFNPNSKLANSVYDGLVNLDYRNQMFEQDENRTLLNRVFDVVNTGQYVSAGVVRGLVDEDITPFEGMVQGLYAGLSGLIPFNNGKSEWEYDFSGVLEKAGWKPESTSGKISRGSVGMALDIFLDPMTYVTGGISGLIKGTGKHSAKAALGAADDIVDVSKGIGMTQEMAEEIIKRTPVFKGGKVEIDLASEAKELTNKYNKLIGINTKDASRTLSLANAPFGKKIFGKYADKSITLIDSDTMKKLGDMTFAPIYGKLRDEVFGSQIGKLFSPNHPLYKLAKTQPEQLYYFMKKVDLDMGLSKGKLAMEQVIRKNAALLGELTPAQQKEIIDALENKTIWAKVKKTVDFIDTKEAARYKKQIETSREIVKNKIDNLTDFINKSKEEIAKLNLSIEEQNRVLDVLKEEYLSQLLTLNENHAVELGKIDEVMKELINASNVIDPNSIENFSKLSDELSKVNGISPEDLVKRFRDLGDEVAVRNADIETKKILLETFTKEVTIDDKKYINKFDEYIKYVNEIEKPEGISDYVFNKIKEKGYIEYKRQDYIDKIISAFPDWQVTKLDNGLTRISPPISSKNIDGVNKISAVSSEIYDTIKKTSKYEFIDDLSTYLFGQKGFISYNTLDDDLGKIIKQIEEGRSVEESLNFIFNNRRLYNGASKEMYQFIAETIGYKNWDKYYTKPMKEYLEKHQAYKKGELKLSKSEADKLQSNIIKLQKDKLKRDLLLMEFKGKTTLNEVSEVIRKFKDEVFQTRDLPEIIDKLYITGVRGETIEELYRNNFNIEDFMSKTTSNVVRRNEKKIASVVALNPEQKKWVYDYYIDFYNFKHSHRTVKQHKQIEGVISTLNDMLVSNNIDFFSLNASEQKRYLEKAHKKYFKTMFDGSTKELDEFTKFSSDVKKINNKSKIHETIFNSVKRNHKIQFYSEGKLVEGFVDKVVYIDGEKVLEVNVDGKTKQITKNLFKGRLSGNRKPQTLDDIRDVSQLYDEFVTKHNDLQESIKQASEMFANQEKLYKKNVELKNKYTTIVEELNTELKNKIDEVTKLYQSQIDEINNKTLEFSKKNDELKEILDSGVEDKIAKYKEEVLEYDTLLNNASAFETYVRSLGSEDSEFVDSIIKKYNPHLGEYVLRDDLDFDETVRRTINQLRKDFITIGEGEIQIGKLSQEQFDNLMYEYVPRILTPDGEELFAKNKEVFKKFIGFGDDFGYGRKFNPYQKSRTITKIPDGMGGYIQNPTISQINEYFKQFTGGKNVFSENLAEIYLARAMKHNELMYDNKYMENMLELFGEDYVGELKEGFSTVMNYGKLKQFTSDLVGVHTSIDISEEISKYLIENDIPTKAQEEIHQLIKANIDKYKNISFEELVSKRISEYIDKYMKTTLTEEVRHKMYIENLEKFFKETNTHGLLDDLATPMVQLDDKQIPVIRSAYDSVMERLTRHINTRMGIKDNLVDVSEIEKAIRSSLESDGMDAISIERMNRILNKIDVYNNFSPPQIKQANNAIVQKANQARKLQIIKDNNALLDLYDKITHFMKLNQTTILPSFHARNKFSNMFNNWFEIGNDAIDIDFQKKTFDVIKGKNLDELFEIVSPDGTITKIKLGDLYQAAQDYGVIDSGVFAKDIGVGKPSKGLLSKLGVPGKLDPTNTKDFIGYTYGSNIGSKVENHDRFIHFASQVRRGMSFKDAAESVNRFLFDYSDLTMFEQSVMKRIFPYYTWLRKNGQLQLEMILEKPEKYRHISKIIGGIEGMVDEKDRIDKRFVNDFAKDWVQTPFYVTNPEGRREPVLWNPNLPFMDISRIPNPLRPLDTMKDLFTQTNPLIKVPIELALNYDVFFESPIAKEDESRLGKSVEHIARQFGVYPVIKGAVEKQGLDFGLHLLNTTSGIKLLSYDYDKYKAMKISEMSKKKERSNTNPGILESIKRRLGEY